MKRSKRPTHRCRECGERLWVQDALGTLPNGAKSGLGDGFPALCRKHPGAELVPWTIHMVWALHYVAHAHIEGSDINAFVETYREEIFPGVTRGDMAMAAVLFKDWVVEKDLLTREGYYRERREPVTPKGLYS